MLDADPTPSGGTEAEAIEPTIVETVDGWLTTAPAPAWWQRAQAHLTKSGNHGVTISAWQRLP